MKFISLVFIAVMFAATARAADIENGNDLHFEHCTGCHDSGVYTRENRNVRNLAQLGKQVRFCKDTIGVSWFDDEVDDVIAYLNATYYHF